MMLNSVFDLLIDNSCLCQILGVLKCSGQLCCVSVCRQLVQLSGCGLCRWNMCLVCVLLSVYVMIVCVRQLIGFRLNSLFLFVSGVQLSCIVFLSSSRIWLCFGWYSFVCEWFVMLLGCRIVVLILCVVVLVMRCLDIYFVRLQLLLMKVGLVFDGVVLIRWFVGFVVFVVDSVDMKCSVLWWLLQYRWSSLSVELMFFVCRYGQLYM